MTTKIHFRGVDLIELSKNYTEGKYKHITAGIPVINKQSFSNVIKKKNVDENKIKTIVNEFKKEFGVLNYMPDSDGDYTQYNFDSNHDKNYNCMYCLYTFNKGIIKQPLGIPVAKTFEGNKIIYHCIDIFCCFECLYAETQIRCKYNLNIYSHSLVLLASMYNDLTNLEFIDLKPAMDKRFLLIYNGYLTHEEFHKNSGRFTTKPEYILLIPATELIE